MTSNSFSQNEDKNNQNVFKYAWYKDGCYRITVKSYLTLGQGKINEYEFVENWLISPKEFNHLSLHIKDKVYIQMDGQMKEFYKILDIINSATQDLEILLNEDKTFQKILNQEEILEKWEVIKEKELKFFELIKESYHTFIQIHDKEFQNLDENIQNNLLYQLLFYPFPITDEGYLRKDNIETEAYSILFPNEKIIYQSKYDIEQNDNLFLVKMQAEGKSKTGSFEEAYVKDYQKTIKLPLDYKYTIEGNYSYNKDSVLDEAIFFVKEQLNSEMLYVCQYKIQLT